MPSPSAGTWMDLTTLLHARLVSLLDLKAVASLTDPSVVRREVWLVVERLLDEANPLFNRWECELTIEQVVADALGFGPLEVLFSDDRVQEVRVDEPDRIRVRLGEEDVLAGIPFRSLEQL